MFYVYVIRNTKIDRCYIGFTKDLCRRLKEHNKQRKTGYTSSGKWKLVYYEAFLSEVDAKTREKRLKQDGRSRYQLMKRIEESLKKVG